MMLQLTAAQLQQFQEDGYIVLPNLFDAEEISLLLREAEGDTSVAADALSRNDGEGGITKLRVWNEEGDDLYGLVARSPRLVHTMEQLLGDEVYFYHSKLNLKEPFTGGAWAWHQDYGYWYNNGCLYPDMGSCMIALDRATRQNGCLQVLKGSHRMGRMDHVKVGDQTGADPDRVEQAIKVCELIYVEKEPGTTLFFHSNLLHRSDQNRSPDRRWVYICCYNTKHNNPYKVHHHPQYHPLQRVSDNAIKERGLSAATKDR